MMIRDVAVMQHLMLHVVHQPTNFVPAIELLYQELKFLSDLETNGKRLLL